MAGNRGQFFAGRAGTDAAACIVVVVRLFRVLAMSCKSSAGVLLIADRNGQFSMEGRMEIGSNSDGHSTAIPSSLNSRVSIPPASARSL